ncbi:MAG: hypothetical protein HYT75_07215 [Deltaproteobacteria bacterium]|nr:hypothetical protein [Deltaproteobacteria bacterium]
MTVITPAIRIWSRENRISSDGETIISALLGLPENALELYGSMVKVDGQEKLNGLFYYCARKCHSRFERMVFPAK